MTDHSQITEFVGTAIGDTIGLVIPGIDPQSRPPLPESCPDIWLPRGSGNTPPALPRTPLPSQ